MIFASATTQSIAEPGFLSPGLLVGFLLFAAICGGYAASLARVPRVVGYLLAGVVLKLLVERFAGGEGAHGDGGLAQIVDSLSVIKTLALGLIMFTIGNVFEVQHIKSVGARALRISLLEVGLTIVLVGSACALVWMFSASASRIEALSAGLLLGVVAVATAPAATLLVIQEYDAKGPASDMMLTLTALNNTISIVLFHALFVLLGAMGIVTTVGGGGRFVALDLLLTTVGSMALGVVLGFIFSVLFARIRLSEFLLIFFAVVIGLGSGADFLSRSLHLSFNFLLTCLFLGATFANITVNSGPLYAGLRTMGSPVYACFFVFAGFELHLNDLGHLGWLGGCYVLLRIVGKYLGVKLGQQWGGQSYELRPYLGLGLLCQAGVAIGLADYLFDVWVDETGAVHALARHFKTIVLGSVVVFELIGPISLKGVVKSSGEVKAITLLRRTGPSASEGDSATKLGWQALLRLFGLGHKGASSESGELTVRHIMRSNVKFLPHSATLDEVLHFVESSRHNHFPVVNDDGNFAGMIHFADLRDMIYDPHMRDLVTAIDLAAPNDMVPADLPLSELLERFSQRDVGSLVVVQSATDRRVLGLVEQRDLLRTLRGEGGASA